MVCTYVYCKDLQGTGWSGPALKKPGRTKIGPGLRKKRKARNELFKFS